VEEDVLDDHALPTLNPISRLALGLEQVLQFGRQIEDATFEVLRRAGIQSHLTRFQVDLAPLQRQDLAVDAPPGDVRKRHDRLHGPGQSGMPASCFNADPVWTACSSSYFCLLMKT